MPAPICSRSIQSASLFGSNPTDVPLWILGSLYSTWGNAGARNDATGHAIVGGVVSALANHGKPIS
jgi:hypothetical protein